MKTHTFPTFTLHNSHEAGSKPLEALTDVELTALTDWQDKDKIIYQTPLIKLKSQIEASGVTLNPRYGYLHDMNARRVFDKPHISIKKLMI